MRGCVAVVAPAPVRLQDDDRAVEQLVHHLKEGGREEESQGSGHTSRVSTNCDPEGLELGYVDLDFGTSLGWWAATMAQAG